MLQTVLIIIHLILIAVVWYIAGNISGEKGEIKEKYEFEGIRNEEGISILNEKLVIPVIVGICLNLAIFYWVVVNTKPEEYFNYIWFVLLVPVSIFIALAAFSSNGDSFKAYIASFVCGFICLCLFFMILLFMIVPNSHMILGEPEETTTRIDIVNVNDSKEVTGSISGGGFLVFSIKGSISTNNVYSYYYQQEDGSFKLASIPADESSIYYLPEGETQGYINKITTTTYYYDNMNYPAVKTDEIESQSERYEIYVPEGSIGTYYEFNGE